MNNKVRYNTYSKNVFQPYQPANRVNTVNSSNCTCNYDKSNNIILSGSDVSGTVWLGNPNSPKYYNVAEQDPGISWVL